MRRSVALALAFTGCAPLPPLQDLSAGQTGAIAYRSQHEDVVLAGFLRLPERPEARVPAVVIIHGTGGIDGRGTKWATFLLEHGIGSLEIDYFGPRGVRDGASRRLPTPTHDVYSALRMLATHPRIDRERLAVLGFSRGGRMALDSADYTATLAGVRTAAHVALYPQCDGGMGLLGDPGLPPVLILSGAEDHYQFNGACQAAARLARARGRTATFKAYPGAYHGWDGSRAGLLAFGYVSTRIEPDAAVTRESMQDALAFLRAAMQLP
jgi:dienelactone hydrolase